MTAKRTTAKKVAQKTSKSFEESLWETATKLRGSVESSEYKHVVLSLIFLKFVSDKFEERRAEVDGSKRSALIEAINNINTVGDKDENTVSPTVNETSIYALAAPSHALIESSEQLIAKKRRIKKGAMQEFLTENIHLV
ncbi:type I restriction-modification system subunit M N-terminal domain-containing protein [Verrucomicrobiaceae bacterium 227]